MKTTLMTLLTLTVLCNGSMAQENGNANYGNNHYTVNRVNTIATTSSNQDEMVIVIKGIYNERATAKIATFSIMQLGKTAEEATSLMDERVNNVIKELTATNKDIELTTDMISFVPTYEYSVEKKIFNPKTYNEKPSGFELKKNLIIKYKNSNDFDKIVAACGRNEIYDLAKVDYVTTNFDMVRSQMQKKALEIFKDQMANYSMIMNTDLNKKEKILQEGFNVSYPMESYRSYQAFSQANANFDPKGVVNNIKKNTTEYYNAALVKDHNFVFNADITEPTIQAFYEITIRIKLKEDQLPKNTIIRNNRYYIITAKGDIKLLNI
ncbi:SIMPL domain-containing protein [Flavobacterium sp. SUN046]|uniref:SIMPL domain-containing protein n=1 Tax=Flavobacterium sp. SUN046 TaxID=3002440 RepID=UPI002DB9C828|nr:SIMPL domain-containing protein [Flavobacterium sp. SUN046]MEC4048326.1 SIMPL domain-containing protein [Flavobacterium sp. SUN046]